LGIRLRSSFGLVVLGALMALALEAGAETLESCWVTSETDRYGIPQTVTRCRISGGSIVDYASDSAVPSQLYAQTGTDLTGQCWYYTSA